MLGPLVAIDGAEYVQAEKVFVMDGKTRFCTDVAGDRFYPVNWPIREADVALGMGPPNRMMMVPGGETVRLCDVEGNVVENVRVEELIERYCDHKSREGV